jgi:hypothetical protein
MDDGGITADAGITVDAGALLDGGMSGDASLPTGDGGDVRADLGAGRPISGCTVAPGGNSVPGPGSGSGSLASLLLVGAMLRRARRVERRGLS